MSSREVLGDDLQQRDVFDITMLRPLQDFLSGTSQLIFTYGVTNSGKTYTLLGNYWVLILEIVRIGFVNLEVFHA